MPEGKLCGKHASRFGNRRKTCIMHPSPISLQEQALQWQMATLKDQVLMVNVDESWAEGDDHA